MLKLVLKTSRPSSCLLHIGQGEMVERLHSFEVNDEIKKLYEDSKNEDNCMTLTVIGLLEMEE